MEGWWVNKGGHKQGTRVEEGPVGKGNGTTGIGYGIENALAAEGGRWARGRAEGCRRGRRSLQMVVCMNCQPRNNVL